MEDGTGAKAVATEAESSDNIQGETNIQEDKQHSEEAQNIEERKNMEEEEKWVEEYEEFDEDERAFDEDDETFDEEEFEGYEESEEGGGLEKRFETEEGGSRKTEEKPEERANSTPSHAVAAHTDTEKGSGSRDSDGAPKPPPLTRPPSSDSPAAVVTTSAASACSGATVAISTLVNLPPGISISGGGGGGAASLPSCISITSATGGPASLLPSGLTISTVKETTAQRWEEDARSTSSSQDRYSDAPGSIRSSTDNQRLSATERFPSVGTATLCVICLNTCGADRRPKLLSCLHSCCAGCFAERLASAKRENAASDVVDLEDDVQVELGRN